MMTLMKKKMTYYRAFDNLTGSDHETRETSHQAAATPNEHQLSPSEIRVMERLLIKTEKCFKNLNRYIEQHTVLGFNSQKYDLPLIRPYLPSSLIKLGHTPKQVIKRGSGYMVIATPKLKFLDITNYLAAGTSLVNFYASFNVSTPKGILPYQWFDSLERLQETSLPKRSESMTAFFVLLLPIAAVFCFPRGE